VARNRRKRLATGGPRGNKRKYRGHELDSDFELEVIKKLYSSRRKLKNSFSFSHESETVDYTISGTYLPDFIIHFKNGHKIYVECKGYLDPQSKKKMLAVRRCHPDLDIRFLFEKNNKIRAGSKMRYVDWALRNGFNDAAVGYEIPTEWLTNSEEK